MKFSLTHTMYALSLMTLINGCASDATLPVSGSSYQAIQRFYVSVDSLNLRECAGTECKIISILKHGDNGRLIARENGWIQLELDEKNHTGWVSERYLSSEFVEKKPAVPGPAADPGSAPKMPEENLAQPSLTPAPLEEELATPEPDISEMPPAVSEELASPSATEHKAPPAVLEEELAQ